MKSLSLTFLLLSIVASLHLSAQNLKEDARPPVFIGNNMLDNPWAGGANSPGFAEIDLNGDGKMDLISLDLVGNLLTPYLNIGTPNQSKYRYAPQYISKFPVMHAWVRTFDYDCDGDLDLFPYGLGAMMAYRNDYNSSSGLQFTLISNQINTNYGSIQSNLYVNAYTIPALVDMDNDGDMDVLSFPVSGSWVEFHKNYAMDSTGNCAGFLFHIQYHYPSSYPEMWGHFFLSAVDNVAVLGVQRPTSIVSTETVQHNLHSGSALFGYDFGCDGDMDLLNGDILSASGNLLYLENGGPPDSMVYQDPLFPSYDTPAQLQNVADANLIDIDNDGKKDMLVTPFANAGEDYYNVLMYKNTGDNCIPNFEFSTNRFLVDQSIDVGTSSRPAFLDVDADGLVDMLIANYQYYNNASPTASYSRLAYFRNTGTATYPMFTLIDKDFVNCSSLALLGLHPTFGDIDGDGDKDMLLGAEDGSLIYYKNLGGAGNAVIFSFYSGFYQNIDVGANSAPQLVDMDYDGLLDLVIGERAGNLNYYRNTGTAIVPQFSYVSNLFGGVNVIQSNAVQGNSSPIIFTHNGSYELLVGSESGYIYQYTNVDGNLNGNFTLLDSTYQKIFVPSHATIAMADIDGDNKFDLLVGNEDGGIRLFTQRIRNTVPPPIHAEIAYNHSRLANSNQTAFMLYPSPANDILTIQLSKLEEAVLVNVSIVDILGKEMLQLNNTAASVKVDVSKLDAGIYFVHVKSSNEESIQKFIKQ